MLVAAMAGEAGDTLIAAEISFVDVPDHREHLARDYLVPVLIAGKISLNMARGAANPEPDRKRAHGGHYFIGFQDLEILRRTRGPTTATTRASGWRLLGKRNGREKKYR
jgi:hypothetical protein